MRRQFNGSGVTGERRFNLTRGLEEIPDLIVRFGEVRFKPERLLKTIARVIQPSLGGKKTPQ